MFLKIPQNLQENIRAGVSFAIKLPGWGLNFIKYRTWYRYFPVTFAKCLRTSILQTSARACLWRVRSLLGVSLCKILGLYYQWNKQLFYYEGTSSYIPLKIPECLNRVAFQNSSELLLLEIHQQTKTCSKLTNKGMFQECCSGFFIINLGNIFEVCDEIWLS